MAGASEQTILRVADAAGTLYDPKLCFREENGVREWSLVVVEQKPHRINAGRKTLSDTEGLAVETNPGTHETRLLGVTFGTVGDYRVQVLIRDDYGDTILFDDYVTKSLTIDRPEPVGADAKLMIIVPPVAGAEVNWRVVEVPIA